MNTTYVIDSRYLVVCIVLYPSVFPPHSGVTEEEIPPDVHTYHTRFVQRNVTSKKKCLIKVLVITLLPLSRLSPLQINGNICM